MHHVCLIKAGEVNRAPTFTYMNIRRLRQRIQQFMCGVGSENGWAIVIARFMPFIRTFAPFLAGVGRMRYSWFLGYNALGGVLWTGLFLSVGYFVGNLPIVKDNFTLIVYAIIAVSMLALVSIFATIIAAMWKGREKTEEKEEKEG